jgi:hypothetical protein
MKRLVTGLVAVVALLVLGRLLGVQHWVLAFVATSAAPASPACCSSPPATCSRPCSSFPGCC